MTLRALYRTALGGSLLLSAVLLAACSGDSSQGRAGDNMLSGAVRLDGSSTVFPISEAVAEEFMLVAPRVRVTVGVSGTGGGFNKFIAGEIDINDASRQIKPTEIAAAQTKGLSYLEVPVAYDGLSIVVNPSNDWVDYLTVEELKMIWQPGSTVDSWDDIRADWPALPLRLYGPGTDSGTFDYFTEVINGKPGASRADYTSSEDDNVLVQGISGDASALGFFGFAYYEENAERLRLVPIDNGSGAVAPSAQSINDGSYSPLSRSIFIYISALGMERTEVRAFVDFYLENAAALATEVGYIPMQDSEYAAVRSSVAKFRQ